MWSPKWKQLQKADRELQAEEQKRKQLAPKGDAWQRLKKIAEKGAVKFCMEALSFKPFKYQIKFLEDIRQFIALLWCRQSGKSWIVAAFLFWFAVEHDGSEIAIVGPSFRQSKLIIRKITGFLPKLPKDIPSKEILLGRKPLKTKISFLNGSIIEAYPNNPDTIRGPTLNLIYCDEMNFIKDDEEMYDAILFTLGTTNGRFIASSTPWSRDHIFYRICKEKEFSDFQPVHHVTWKNAEEPNGPLKTNILNKIRKQLEPDPWRWQREMEAEWAEDESCWLSTSLITACTDPGLEIREFDKQHSFWAEGLGGELPS